jgi:hypothetical protein
MARTTALEMRKYFYTTVDTENLELLGSHSTIATITKEEALQLAQELIACAMNKDADGVRVDFEMREPIAMNEAPTLSLYFGSAGGVKPKLHWAMVEGHQIFELSDTYSEAN